MNGICRSLAYVPLKDKTLLKHWIHVIGRANLPLNASTRICSRHFVKAAGRRLYPGEVPSEELPVLSTTVMPNKCRKPPKVRPPLSHHGKADSLPAKSVTTSTSHDVGMNTEWDPGAGLEAQATRRAELEGELLQVRKCLFRLENIDRMVSFYTGFPSYIALYTCFKFLGPAVDYLRYSEGKASGSSSEKRFRPHDLAPLEEFFLVLARLRLGLMEQTWPTILVCRRALSPE